MVGQIRSMKLGPTLSQYRRELARGNCPECGGQCSPECGIHPKGCIFGGMDPYWMICDDCKLDHGE
jgi:hypothetical protein